jgi:hypothetical protein
VREYLTTDNSATTTKRYAEAQQIYLDAGWPKPLPIEGDKRVAVSGFHGANGRPKPHANHLKVWRRLHATDDIALAMPPDVFGADLDEYKVALGQIERSPRAALEELIGCKLPPTWMTTSRDDGSGILLYRVPPLPKGKRWKSAPVPGCESVTARERYALVWPSIHPKTGQPYRWIEPNGEIAEPGRVPSIDELAYLPLEALDALIEDDPACVTRAAIDFDLTDGPLTADVSLLLARGHAACNGNGDGTSRHAAVRDVVMGIARRAEQGDTGTALAIDNLRTRFVAAVGPDRSGGHREAEGEFESMLKSARAKVATTEAPSKSASTIPTLLDEFWNAHTMLSEIRQYAHANKISAGAMLVAVLTRVAAAIPHTIELPGDGYGAARPLSTFAIIVAPSGIGKTIVHDRAKRYLPIKSADVADDLPAGSGEGFAEVFFGLVPDPSGATYEQGPRKGEPKLVKGQTKHGAYFYVDEGRVVTDLQDRKGATLLPTVCSMFNGSTVGNTNASRETKRILPAGSYNVGMLIALQPKLARDLLADAPAGTPQRFLFAHGIDPTVPFDAPSSPEALEWTRPHPSKTKAERNPMRVDASIVDEISRKRHRIVTGQDLVEDDLAAHETLNRFKTAGNLSLLFDPDGMTITAEHWRLAGMVMEYSNKVRALVVEELREVEAQTEAATSERLARRQAHAVEHTHAALVVKAAASLWRKVPADGEITFKAAKVKLSKPQRDVAQDALDHAIAEGWLTEREEPSRTDRPKRVLKRGKERPLDDVGG